MLNVGLELQLKCSSEVGGLYSRDYGIDFNKILDFLKNNHPIPQINLGVCVGVDCCYAHACYYQHIIIVDPRAPYIRHPSLISICCMIP